MINVAHVTFTDTNEIQEIRGYIELQATLPGGLVFMFKDSAIILPWHRIKEISCTEEEK